MMSGIKANLKKMSYRVLIDTKHSALTTLLTLLYVGFPITYIVTSVNLNSVSTFVVFLITAQLIHIFFYFSTIYQYSKYTSVVKFFWLRVFAIFWGLEFYLFGIVMFLFFIAPAELPFFWELRQIKLDKRWPTITSSHTYILTLITVFNINILGYYTVYKNKLTGYSLLLLLVFCMLYILLKELEVYYYYSLSMTYKKNIPTASVEQSSVVVLSNKDIPGIKPEDIVSGQKTSNYLTADLFAKQFTDEVDHYKARFFILNIILSVKFWHVYITILINLVYVYIIIYRTKQNTLEVLGLWQQNLTILLVFWALNYVIYFKMYYKKSVYGFYSNITTYDILTDYSSLWEEFYLI